MVIDSKINSQNDLICKNIDLVKTEGRAFASQNILNALRTFVEYLCLKAYCEETKSDLLDTKENIDSSVKYLSSRAKFKSLILLRNFLEKSKSHFVSEEDAAQRLMLKYYEYLLKIKTLFASNYSFIILQNIDKFPIDLDDDMVRFYESIQSVVNNIGVDASAELGKERYYIHKKKPIYLNGGLFYEITLVPVESQDSKFCRATMYTSLDIDTNYAISIAYKEADVKILGKDAKLQIIDNWKISIRPCEFSKLLYITTGKRKSDIGATAEYENLMRLLLNQSIDLLDIVLLDDASFSSFSKKIIEGARTYPITTSLLSARKIIKKNFPGSNLLRYLLHSFNNSILEKQIGNEPNAKLSNLFVAYGCIPFDKMPFAMSLINHNPSIYDLLSCLDSDGRDSEFLSRTIENNANQNGCLYTRKELLSEFGDVPGLCRKYNEQLYYKHGNSKLVCDGGYTYIKENEDDSVYILKKLKELASSPLVGYKEYANQWLEKNGSTIDDPQKIKLIKNAFVFSHVVVVNGPAGTGKSTAIKLIASLFPKPDKLFLANTHPAVDNLNRCVTVEHSHFSTIKKYLKTGQSNYPIVFVDECSTVSNSDMMEILKKAQFEIIVLAGDIYQIESILFGNWFSLALSLLPMQSIFELTSSFRCKDKQLLNLWSSVRSVKSDCDELFDRFGYSKPFDNSLFAKSSDDEVVLCLNYDGLYGVNNLNRLLQISNPNEPVKWSIWTFKKGDPILFNETKRFSPLIYDNMKGVIASVSKTEDRITFDVELDTILDPIDIFQYPVKLLSKSKNGNSIIEFTVDKEKNPDADDDELSSNVIPFQIAYAISIHKAQGLEFDSVKVVITDEVAERITHSVFYTAITRAKKHLCVYWSPETQRKLLSTMKPILRNDDKAIITKKYPDLI